MIKPSPLELLARDKHFIQLNELRSKFNIFHATDMGRQEIKHTKFLSYLLDPHRPHGLGSKFLRLFLIECIANIQPEANNIKLLDLDLSDVQVIAEYGFKIENTKGSIDLLILIGSKSTPETRYIIAIENKIDATLGTDQLDKYDSALQFTVNNKNYLLTKVYLTHHSQDEETRDWIRLTYEDVVIPALKKLISTNIETASSYIISILQDYTDLLSEEESGESETLASKITTDFSLLKQLSKPKSFRESISIEERSFKNQFLPAIEYLSTFDNSPLSKIYRVFNQIQINGDQSFTIESSCLSFLRFSFFSKENSIKLKSIKSKDRKWLASGMPLAAEIVIRQRKNSIELLPVLVLGPISNEIDREDFVKKLRSNTKSENNSRQITSTWTRILKEDRKFIHADRISIDSAAVLTEIIKSMIEKYKNEIDSVISNLELKVS